MYLSQEFGGAPGGVEGAAAAVDLEGVCVGRERGELGELAEDRFGGSAGDDRHAAFDEGFDAGDRGDDEGQRGEVHHVERGRAELAGDTRRVLGAVEVEFEERVEVDGGGSCIHVDNVTARRVEARGRREAGAAPLPTCCQFGLANPWVLWGWPGPNLRFSDVAMGGIRRGRGGGRG